MFALSSLSIVLASISTLALAAPQHAHGLIRKPAHAVAAHSHQKRINGRATWYAVGLGACGDYNQPNDFIVALNSHQLDSSRYPPVQCNRWVRITYQGKSATAQVKDECPGCPYGSLDMSKGLFQHFTGLGTGVFYMEWDWVGGPGDNNDDDDKKEEEAERKKKEQEEREREEEEERKKEEAAERKKKEEEEKEREEEEERKKEEEARRTSTTSLHTSTTSRATTSSTRSTTSSSVAASPSKGPDSNVSTTSTDTDDDGVSNIASQQQFIANLGNMASMGRSS